MGRAFSGSAFIAVVSVLVFACTAEETLTPHVAPRPSSAARASTDACSEAAVADAIASIPPAAEAPPQKAPDLVPLGFLIAEPAAQRPTLPAELPPHVMPARTFEVVGVTRKPDFPPFDISNIVTDWTTIDALLPEDVRPLADTTRRLRKQLSEVSRRPELEGCRPTALERSRSSEAVLRKALEPLAAASDAAAVRLAVLERDDPNLDLDAPDSGVSAARLARVAAKRSAEEELGRTARYELGWTPSTPNSFREIVEASSTPTALRADALYRWATLEDGEEAVELFERLDVLLANDTAQVEPVLRAAAAMGWFWAATRLDDPKSVARALARLATQASVWSDFGFAEELGARLGRFLARAPDWKELRGASIPSVALASAAVALADDALERGIFSLTQRAISVVEEHGRAVPSLVEAAARLHVDLTHAEAGRSTPRARAIHLSSACVEEGEALVPFTLEWTPRTPQGGSTFAVRGLEKRGPSAAALEACLRREAPHALWDAPPFTMQIGPAKR